MIPTPDWLSRQIVVDVETSGPTPRYWGVLQIGAVTLTGAAFEINVRLEADRQAQAEALRAIGLTEEQVRDFRWGVEPAVAAVAFDHWLEKLPCVGHGGRTTMWSDNPAFDWQFIHDLLWTYCGQNRLGYSARRIGDYFAGQNGYVSNESGWKSLRRTKHSHRAIDDARGNAEALRQLLGLEVPG